MNPRTKASEIRVLAQGSRIEVRVNGLLAGWLAYQALSSNLHIEDLFVDDGVDPNFSSRKQERKYHRRRGYGSILLQAAEAMARRDGLTSIDGIVTANDLASTPGLIAWYRRRGFKVTIHPDGFLIRKML